MILMIMYDIVYVVNVTLQITFKSTVSYILGMTYNETFKKEKKYFESILYILEQPNLSLSWFWENICDQVIWFWKFMCSCSGWSLYKKAPCWGDEWSQGPACTNPLGLKFRGYCFLIVLSSLEEIPVSDFFF